MGRFEVVSALLVAAFVFLLALSCCEASKGDQSRVHRNCLVECARLRCMNLKAFEAKQPLLEWLLGWHCVDECEYHCMWRTVKFGPQAAEGVVHQFHGKWPFLRLWGVQEPASALFSLFNLVVHAVMINKFIRKTDTASPTYWVWISYAAVSINAWIWSTVFHTRDVSWTEKMDYFCAFSIVLFQLLAFFHRIFCSDASWTRTVAVTAIAVAVYAHHLHKMLTVRFDYGYNMKVNIIVGIVQSVLWLSWSWKNRHWLPHVKWIARSILAMDLSILLEVLEFEPILWTFDSHALWHLSTAPLHILTYTFAIHDCAYLLRKKDELVKQKLP